MEIDGGASEVEQDVQAAGGSAEGVLDTEESVAALFLPGGAAEEYRSQWLCGHS